MIKDMDREPFAKVVSFGEGVGEDFRIEIEGIPVYCPNNDSGQTADKINAAVDAREKALLDKHTARIAELDECMRQAGLQCFIPNGKPEEISKHMESVSKSWIEEKKKSEDRISELDRVLENTLQSLCVLCDFIEVEYPRNFDEEEHTLFLEDIDNMKVKIRTVLGKGKP